MKRGRVFYKGRVLDAVFDGSLFTPIGEKLDESEIAYLPPATPSKIVCIGRNYMEHAKELGNEVPSEPLIFLKAPSSLLAHKGSIVLPPQSDQVEYEGEIGLVIKDTCRGLKEKDNPMDHVLGFFPLNDVTARDLQKKDVQFTRAKSFDTFCAVAPFYEDAVNYEDLTVETFLNGTMVQHGSANDMAFSIPFLIRYISNIMTLCGGDIIATGTPSGVGRLREGDKVEVAVAGIKLENTVVKGSGGYL
jgi:2-keto-4-pentenoate hydratase/2-oxohepta-3-ene-1,7-dioic acid hydratase in catechol pathway